MMIKVAISRVCKSNSWVVFRFSKDFKEVQKYSTAERQVASKARVLAFGGQGHLSHYSMALGDRAFRLTIQFSIIEIWFAIVSPGNHDQ
jgi:hypothetical protein